MNLINNIYFILRFTRCVLNFISNIPYFIYTVITCSINFNYIVIRTLCDSFTNRTFITRFTIVTIKTINSLGKNLCNTSFTRTSRTTKNICMGLFTFWNCITQRFSYMRLSNHIIKTLRSIHTIQSLVIHRSTSINNYSLLYHALIFSYQLKSIQYFRIIHRHSRPFILNWF